MPLPNGFTAIKEALGNSHGSTVNLIGVIVSIQEPRPTRGTDWCLVFDIQDDFTNNLVGGSSSIRCRLFRPGSNNFPKITGVGDIAILRNFKMNAWGARVDCVSDSRSYTCGMLVFPANRIPIPELSQAYQLGNQRLPYSAMHGTKDPTTQEQMAVLHLKHAASGSVQQVQQHAATSSFKPATRDKLSLVKDLVDLKFYDVRAQVVNTYYTNNGTVELKVTDYTSNDGLFFYVPPEEESAYTATNTSWTGPYGQLTLNVILFESNAAWAREHVSAGDFVYLKNMRTKLSPMNKLEGALHQDRDNSNQVDIRKLINQSDIEEINKRREAYEKQRGSKSAPQALRDVLNDTSAKSGNKKAEKKKRQREQKEAELKDLEKKEEGWAAQRSGVNTNIRAAFPEMKPSTISEIIYNPNLKIQTSKYNDCMLPFVNARHRARVRVIDVFPPELELFAHPSNDRKWCKKPKKQDPNGRTKIRWEWGFVLLLEDASVPPNTVSEKLRVVVGNDIGQGLLNQNALDLKKSPQVLKRLEERLFILWGNLMELKTDLRARGSDLPLPPGDNRLLNKPFDCCIEEYGHEVPITEQNPVGYQRMHRLVQTFITV